MGREDAAGQIIRIDHSVHRVFLLAFLGDYSNSARAKVLESQQSELAASVPYQRQ